MKNQIATGALMEMKTWFVLFENPTYLFRSFDLAGEREALKLIHGNPCVRVLEGPIQVSVLSPKEKIHRDLVVTVPMWRVRIESVKEQHGTWWQAVGSEDDGIEDLEGWILESAFTDEGTDVIIAA